jgi:hypothetical protein
MHFDRETIGCGAKVNGNNDFLAIFASVAGFPPLL